MYTERYKTHESILDNPIERDLRNFHEGEKLDPDVKFLIQPLSPNNPPIQAIENKSMHVKQELRGMLVIGSDVLSIINVTINEGNEIDQITVLAHLRPDERADIIACVPEGGNPVVIGRAPQEFANFNNLVSKEHLAISQTSEGVISILDLMSRNGTEVFISEPVTNSNSRYNTDPMGDHKVWSVSSRDVAIAFGLNN